MTLFDVKNFRNKRVVGKSDAIKSILMNTETPNYLKQPKNKYLLIEKILRENKRYKKMSYDQKLRQANHLRRVYSYVYHQKRHLFVSDRLRTTYKISFLKRLWRKIFG